MSEVHHGGCLCGAVRYKALGQPLKVLVCHCSLCQRVTGSAFAVEATFSKAKVEFSGEPAQAFSYRPPEHGRQIDFSFCPACGTRIGLTLERFPKVQILYGGTFDEPAWVKPDCHIFMKSAAPWMVLPAEVERFEHHLFELDGRPALPIKARAGNMSK